MGGWSSNMRCFIIHPGGGSPDFVLSVEADGFKVGLPCQGVNKDTTNFPGLVEGSWETIHLNASHVMKVSKNF